MTGIQNFIRPYDKLSGADPEIRHQIPGPIKTLQRIANAVPVSLLTVTKIVFVIIGAEVGLPSSNLGKLGVTVCSS